MAFFSCLCQICIKGFGYIQGVTNLRYAAWVLIIAKVLFITLLVLTDIEIVWPGGYKSGRILEKVDKTGLPDIALESLGGLIVSTRDAEAVTAKVRISVFGLPLTTEPVPPPETIIRYTVEPVPGNCWAFKGSHGSVVVQLIKPAKVTGFHLEHIHKNLDPYGQLGSAPREIHIWGMRNLGCLTAGTRASLGNYTFTPKLNPVQYFPVEFQTDDQFSLVELEVLNNHGDSVTCIYRFRVHGDIIKHVKETCQ